MEMLGLENVSLGGLSGARAICTGLTRSENSSRMLKISQDLRDFKISRKFKRFQGRLQLEVAGHSGISESSSWSSSPSPSPPLPGSNQTCFGWDPVLSSVLDSKLRGRFQGRQHAGLGVHGCGCYAVLDQKWSIPKSKKLRFYWDMQ